ncbi:MAG: hypothetical protein ACJ8DI_00505 [Ktedonobacteraceae bacterium]
MATFACERRKTRTYGPIQSLNKRGVAFLTSLCHQEERLSFLTRSSRNVACNFHHPLVLGRLDDRGNAQLRPDFQTASSPPCLLFHLVTKRPHTTFGVRGKPVGTDKQGVHALTASTNVLEETINERAIPMLTDHWN